MQLMQAFVTPIPVPNNQTPFPRSLTPLRPQTAKMCVKINVGSVPEKLSAAITTLASETLSQKPTFTLAISGGSLPKLLGSGLSPDLDISSWRAYLADERLVPLDDPDSNYREVRDKIPGLEVIPAATELPPPACAEDYANKIEDFDVVLLGLGPDGHTCSLFPDHPLSERRVAWVLDSPKPPPKRITLTLPVLNNAKRVMFVCTGAGKAPVVKDILENPDSKLPGALVKPETGVEWFLDEAAAAELSDATKA